MNTLFPIEPQFPGGFFYLPDFITVEEEEKLLLLISGISLHNMIFQGFEAKRKVASFGAEYHFDTRKLTAGLPVPDGFNFIVGKVAQYTSLPITDLSRMLITEYPPGSVINWHRDAPPYELIAGVSLLSDCTFRLRPYDASLRSRSSTLSFPVQRRSLYVMSGESRENWQHSISPVKETRYSITLRTLRDQAGYIL